ncbi:hypothetical protein ACEPAG_9340 [Sanghuangporus baumii]
MESSLWLYPAILLLAFCAAIYFKQGTRRLPPSPSGFPFLGHVMKIPQTFAWRTFAEWENLYGPVIFLKALGRPIIVVNSTDAACDLLEKKGANLSDRPKAPLLEMIGWNETVAMMPYGHAQFRKQRRLMQEHLGTSAIRSYDRILIDRVRKFLHRLWLYPDEFCQDIHGHVASIIIEVVYGHSISGNPVNDTCIVKNERAARISALCGNAGATVIDIFPFLRFVPAWVPGMGLKRKALEARDAVRTAFSLPFEEAKSKKASGIEAPSILYRLLDEYDDLREMSHEEEMDLKNFAGTFYNGGTDTTRTAITMFFLMMVFNQDIQKRAQNEIDSLIGVDRLPLPKDRANLPYIDCILKEVLRFHPPAPLGFPHASIQTDGYCGWTIPARSMIMPNVWHMMRDVNAFPNPEKFDPDRHAIRGDTAADDLVFPVFGFGRRACPGRAFAESIMWTTIANVLAAFDILPSKDPETGEDIYPVPEFESGVVHFVKPFECRIVPRKERLAQIAPDS